MAESSGARQPHAGERKKGRGRLASGAKIVRWHRQIPVSNSVLSGKNPSEADAEDCLDSGPVSIRHQRIANARDSAVAPLAHTDVAESDRDDKRDTIPSPPPIEEAETNPR